MSGYHPILLVLQSHRAVSVRGAEIATVLGSAAFGLCGLLLMTGAGAFARFNNTHFGGQRAEKGSIRFLGGFILIAGLIIFIAALVVGPP